MLVTPANIQSSAIVITVVACLAIGFGAYTAITVKGASTERDEQIASLSNDIATLASSVAGLEHEIRTLDQELISETIEKWAAATSDRQKAIAREFDSRWETISSEVSQQIEDTRRKFSEVDRSSKEIAVSVQHLKDVLEELKNKLP